jgi:hypothetical protein
MRCLVSRLRLSVASRILLPLLVLLAWLPGAGAATAATASIGLSVQVCTTAPQCSPDNNSEWASTAAVQSGATVVWRVSITNTGSVALTSIVTNDAGNADCAGAVTAGPLQPGQVTAYTCHSDNVTQATTNTASATGTPPSGPNVTSATSSASVTISSGTTDPNAGISALVQVCILAVLTSCDPGNAADWAASATVYTSIIRWRVVITNTGTDTLTGITAATSLPQSESDCGGSVPPGTLNAGGVIDYECETDNVTPPSTFTQTVTASGQPPTGPVITSAGSTATAQVAADNPPPGSGISAQLQICVLSNLAACDPTNAADWASSATLSSTTARWRVVVTNTGTLALSSIYASDTLAQTDCGGFVASSLAAGATTQYACQTNNVTQTTVNSLTVTGNTPPSGVPITSAAATATAVVGVSNGGIGFVQGTAFGTGTRVTSLTVTLGGPVGAGHLLVGWVAEYNAAGNVTVSDSVNGAWTRSAAAETFGNGTGDIALFYLPGSKASSSGVTVTITAPAGAYLQGSIAEYSGVATSAPLDQAQAAKGNGTAATAGPTSAVPVGELVYSALLTGGSPGSVTPGSSQGLTYTERAATSSGSAYEQDILAAAAGTQTTTATLGTATDWYAVVATFRP